MRKSVFIFLSLLSTISASAQEKAYEPLLKEGKVWRYSYISYFYNEDHYHVSHEDWVRIKGKETVGDHEYFLILLEEMTADANIGRWAMASTTPGNGYDGEDSCLCVHVRDDNGRVFILKDDYISLCVSKYGVNPDISSMQMDGEDDVLLYDFSLSVGDTYPIPGHVTVTETGEISFDGTAYPYQLLSDSLLIVEGFGCVNSFGGLFAYQSSPVMTFYDGYYRYVTFLNWLVVYDDEREIFQYMNHISEEQLLGVYDVTVNKHPQDSPIYDTQGRRLVTPPSHGIYIRGGRKYGR
jgi:hypothetical protein